MALEKFNWQNGSQVEPAKVEVGGVVYEVTEAQYEGETPLSSANLNLMQDTILGNVKDNLEDESKIPSCKAVKDIYSTTEVKTNKVWIDGKPIYRTVYTKKNQALQSGTQLSHNIANIDSIIPTSCVGLSSSTEMILFPSTVSASNNDLGVRINTTKITFVGNDSWSASNDKTIVAIIEYTKTTD